jgi:hypothetical protein
VFLISCGKDSEVFTPYEPTGNIEDFFAEVQLPFQSYQALADKEIFIVTDNNNIIKIPAYSMIDPDGNIVSDAIDIEVVEIFKKGDMVLHNKPTVTADDILITGGEFYIKARKDGKTLSMKDGYSYQIFVPNQNPDPAMQLFYGSTNTGSLIWSEAPEGNENIRVNEWQLQDSSGVYSDFGYVLNCDKFTWINIDKYNDIPDEDKTSVCVSLPEELYNPNNTVIFMVLKDDYSVVAFAPDADKKLWCEPYGKVPKGWEVYLLAISSQGEDVYHFGIIDVTITENDVFTIIPEEKSFEDIKAILEGL